MPRLRLQSLRTRLLLLILLTLAVASIVPVVSTLGKRDIVRQTAENSLRETAQLLAGHVQTILQFSSEMLRALVQRPEIRAMSPAVAEPILSHTQKDFPSFSHLVLLRPDGSPVAASVLLPPGTTYADQPLVRQALTTKTLAYGRFPGGAVDAQEGLALAAPVRSESGQILGICVLNLRTNWFSQLFASPPKKEGDIGLLANDHGVVFAAWPDVNALSASLKTNDPATGVRTPTASKGAPFYIASAPVKSDLPGQLHVRLERPVNPAATGFNRRLQWEITILALDLLGALVAASLLIEHSLLRPARHLADIARAIDRGDLDRRSNLRPEQGELAALGQALDAMADTLRERIRFTQALLNAVPAPLFAKNFDGHYLGCNTAYETCFHTLSEISGKTSREVDAFYQAYICEKKEQELRQSQQDSIEYEAQLVFKDGTLHDMIVSKSLFKNADGQPAGIIGMAMDITTRKQSERALAASEMKYKALVASMRDGFAVISQDGRIVDSNPAFQEMLGYPPEQLTQLTYKDLTPENWHAAQEALLRDAVDTQGFSDIFEKEYRRKDGNIIPVALRLHRYPFVAGDNNRYFAIVRDITDVKAFEADLRQAKDAAEMANRAKSDFLAKMSHDLRTPLHAVIGMTELTLATPLSAPQRDALNTIRESAATLLELINSILDISRIEARKLELVQEPFDLRRTLACLIRTMRPQADSQGLGLTLAIHPDTPRYVVGDQMRLRQILANLIGNGIKFTKQGGVDVTVSPKVRADPTPKTPPLVFTVSDTGIGIAPDKLTRVFEMFTQADMSVTRQYGGTGLGLAICRELTRLMEGRIDTESRPGQGSTFRVTLPLATAKKTTTAIPPVLEHRGEVMESTNIRKLRILLAEDNPVNVKVATTYLSRRGHAFRLAKNGREALEALRTAPFDVVLMDVEMPELDGLEATRRLRAGQAGSQNQHIPVLAMTAHALAEARRRCLEAGMTGYLSKPLDFHDLDAILEKIGRENAPKPPQTSQPPASEPDTLWEREKALQRLGGDTELLKELEVEFLRQVPRKLRLIILCRENENWEEAALNAHSLKNVVGAIGAESSRVLAGKLETYLRQADAQAAHDTFQELQRILSQVEQAVRAQS